MADTDMNEEVTLTSRKRPYRGSMKDGSMEHSVLELEELMDDDSVSPTTKKILGTMSFDIDSFRIMGKNTIGYVTKQCELLRTEKISEMYLQRVRGTRNCLSHMQMVDEKRILKTITTKIISIF
jgi:hypothetical protein